MISRKDFEKGNFKKRVTNRKEHPVAKLLRINKSMALKVGTIVKETGIGKNTVRSMLSKLKKDGLVVHKAPYFAWK